MKPILIILLFFISTISFSQDLTLEISTYPSDIDRIMQQFQNIKRGKEIKFTINGDKFRTTQRLGSEATLAIYPNESSDYSLWLEAIYKSRDREKGNIEILQLDDKKHGEFKVKTSGSDRNTGFGFSANGKYLTALGINKGTLLAYQYNIATGELEMDAMPIAMDKTPKSINAVASAGNGNYIYATDWDYGITIIDLKSKMGKYIENIPNGYNYEYIFASLTTNHFLIADDETKMLIDGENGNVILSENKKFGRMPPQSFFVSADGNQQYMINDEKLTGQGIGMVSTLTSLIVFDQDFNYFTLSDDDEKVTVLNHIKIDGSTERFEPQPDPIPIISDNLSTEGIKSFFEKTADICEKYGNRTMAYQIFESAEPFSDELVTALSQTSEQYVVEYVGKYVAQWINNTPKMELAEAGKSTNVNRKKFMDNYASYSKNLSQEEYGSYLADETEIQNAFEKIQPLTVDLYYMSVEELFKKGNESLQLGAKLSPKAALLGIKFYEVAAEKEPTEPIYQVSIGSAYMYAGQYENAIESYNKALAIRPDYPLALFGIMKASFEPITKGKTKFNNNVAKSIQSNADRFLEVAPDNYLSEMKYAKRAKAFAKLYLDDPGLYNSYNQATGVSNLLMRTGAVELLMPKIAATGNTYLVADMANVSGFDYIKIAKSNNNEIGYYKKADELLRKSVKGGVYDPETYYEWARINISFLNNKEEGKKIVAEAQKKYPADKNFGILVANDYYDTGRKYFLSETYTKAIPQFEKYLANAGKIVPKAYDYLGVSYYYTKNYSKAAKNFELLKSKDNPNTLQAFYPNFDAVLSYAKKPSGVAPKLIDNGDKIMAIEDQYVEGTSLIKKGQRSEGIRLMEEASAYYDQINYDYGQSITHSGLGVEYHQSKEYDKAKTHYKQCIDAGAQSSTCYNNLAALYIGDNQISEAKAVLKQGLNKFPDAKDLAKVKKYLYD